MGSGEAVICSSSRVTAQAFLLGLSKPPTPISVLDLRSRLHDVMELSGFRVSIHSDGEDLKEYSIEVSPDGKKATCWVPSQSGKVRYI